MTEATVWLGGRIFTGRRYVEALAVEGGRVVGAGTDAEVRRLAPTGADRRALDGRLLLPGLVDAHLHLGELAREGPDLATAGSLDALLQQLDRWAAAHPTGPVVGRGWSEERLGLGRLPVADDLARGPSDRALVLYHASGHAAWLNRHALALAGLEEALADLPASWVRRGADGRPSGLLFEDALRPLARSIEADTLPSPGAFEATVRGLAAFGLTRVGTMSTGLREAEALRDLALARRLPITVRAYPRLPRLDEFPDALLAHRSERLAFVGAKGFLDGAFGPRTAWLSAPYADAPETSGFSLDDGARLAEQIRGAVDRGLAPALHAIGDRAIERAAALLEPYANRAGAPSRIEHVGLTPPETLAHLDRVRPALVVQPGFVWSDTWLPARLGAGRARWAYLFRTLLDRGHLLAGSSDAPYDPVDPWRGIRAAVDRRDALGHSANPLASEALAPEEAVALYTVRAAAALGDRSAGSLEPGSPADLLVLEAPDLGAALRSPARPVRETWVAGAPVFLAADGETV
jgi:predicted amidohydrolase YtcJ